MIEFKNVSKKFKLGRSEIPALDRLNFRVAEGEIVAVTGESGSGKTTLLNIAGCILKPSSGEYFFNGKLVAGNETEMAKFRMNYVGFVLQHFALIKHRTVRYNIALPLRYRDMGKAEIEERVAKVADSLGISSKLNAYPHMLSGGECQRVAIARAVISNPKVIIADEPTSSLDSRNKREVLDILKNLNRNGTTVMIATHDDIVTQICSREISVERIHRE